MKDEKLRESITLSCPSGHRLRGDASFIGKKVKCPRCQAAFVISAPKEKQVTDTAVMRILGDLPVRQELPRTDPEPERRPCPRCDVSISQDAQVCQHCNCYVGVMPRFMTEMFDDRQAG
jgi:hypothetical protein